MLIKLQLRDGLLLIEEVCSFLTFILSQLKYFLLLFALFFKCHRDNFLPHEFPFLITFSFGKLKLCSYSPSNACHIYSTFVPQTIYTNMRSFDVDIVQYYMPALCNIFTLIVFKNNNKNMNNIFNYRK